MNKYKEYQEAVNNLENIICDLSCELKQDYELYTRETDYEKYIYILQELVDKEKPKKLKSKTDKDGRLLWICPNCGDVYMKFWSDVETITCRKYCDECGQKLDWSEENE